MGVLSCDRRNCTNIMCDRHSWKYGYLCEECFDELVNRGTSVDLEEFMGSEPRRCRDEIPNAYDKWDEEFPARRS